MKWYIVPLIATAAFALTYGLADALLADSQDAQGEVTAVGVPPAFTLLFSKSNDRSNPEGLEGKTVDGDIYVFTGPDDGVDDVDFFLDGSFRRREKNPAFDFNGGSALIGNAWGTPEVGDGEHTIMAELLLLDGSTVDVSATFTVLNNAPIPTPTPTPPPQQREDQITIFGDAQAVQGTVEFSVYAVLSPGILFALDPADYPASANYRLEAVMRVSSNSTQCVRLLSRTAAAPVAGSDACFATGPSSGHVRVRSLPFPLSSGENEYTLEAKFDGSRGEVFAARIVVEWTE